MPSVTNRQSFKEYCYDNKYSKWYFSIIENAKERNWCKKNSPVYGELHHILPKSIIQNKEVVFLTAKEHFICHLLLPRMLIDNEHVYKMQKALWNLSHTRNAKLNSSSYEKLRQDYSKNCSIFMAGKNNPMYGKNNSGYKHTEEHKERMSNMFKGAKNPMYGKTHSDIFFQNKCKKYRFVYDNEKVEVFNLRKFCRDNNLDQGAMVRVNSEKQNIHKGYSKCRM